MERRERERAGGGPMKEWYHFLSRLPPSLRHVSLSNIRTPIVRVRLSCSRTLSHATIGAEEIVDHLFLLRSSTSKQWLKEATVGSDELVTDG